jgi:hypothetical protein
VTDIEIARLADVLLDYLMWQQRRLRLRETQRLDGRRKRAESTDVQERIRRLEGGA